MKTNHVLFVRELLLVTLVSGYVYLAFAKEGPSVVQIVRNIAWNDFITRIKFLPDDSPQDSLDKEMLIIQKFLKRYEAERTAGIYDFAVLRAIVQVHARLQKADKDLKILRNALSNKEQQETLGR